MHRFLRPTALACALALAGAACAPVARAADLRNRLPHAEGGGAAGIGVHAGSEGGFAARGRVLRTDGAGGATLASGRVLAGPEGGTAGRAGATTAGADGSLQHRSGFAVHGAQGDIESSGSASRTAEGTTTQSRTTTVTGTAHGGTAVVTSGYDSATGRSRSAVCYDATGASIACPTRP